MEGGGWRVGWRVEGGAWSVERGAWSVAAPEFHAAIVRASSSTTVNLTLGHLLAMTMAWGAPTWPAPMTHTFVHEAMVQTTRSGRYALSWEW